MPASAPVLLPQDTELSQVMSELALDPLLFVRECYPWRQPGDLEAYDGPDAWQAEMLEEIGQQVRAHRFNGVDPVPPVRIAVSSGRGIGKGAFIAWIVNWIMSTRRNAVGTVTANTNDQLEEKTWAAVRQWTKRCITAHWWEINSKALYRKGAREAWKCTPQSCAPENSEAFQGQHNATSSSFMIFDEASGIADQIFDAAEGGLTDGEPFIILTGNPTKASGRFHQVVFGNLRNRWTTRVIDARTCKMPNQRFIGEWIDDFGLESDFVRVHVRGLPPTTDALTWIDAKRIADAQVRIPQVLPDEPLMCGVDVSGGGSAMTVIAFRKGNDARAIPWITLTGEQTNAHDRRLVVAKLADVLHQHDIAAMNIDTAFGAAIATRLRDMGFRNVFEVSFGSESPDATCANLRAYMYRQVKDWLGKDGCIDQHDHRLATDLGAFGWHLDRKNRLVIESKESMQKRGVASIDRSDSLALTFATRVAPKVRRQARWGAVSQSPYS